MLRSQDDGVWGSAVDGRLVKSTATRVSLLH